MEQLERYRPLEQEVVVLHSVLSVRSAAATEVATVSAEDSLEVLEEVAVATRLPPLLLIPDLVQRAREILAGQGTHMPRDPMLPEAEAEALEQSEEQEQQGGEAQLALEAPGEMVFSLQFQARQHITAAVVAVEIDTVARPHQEVLAGVGLVHGRLMQRDQTQPWLERMDLVAAQAAEQTRGQAL